MRCPNCGYDTLEERSGLVTGGARGKGAATIRRWRECSNCGFTEGLVKPLIPPTGKPAVDNLIRTVVWGGLMAYGLAIGVFLSYSVGNGWFGLALLVLPILLAEILYDSLKGRLFGN
jgi:hypothetical protein